MSGIKYWTAKERGYLRECYASWGARELGEMLGRSAQAVKIKANKLGLTVPHEDYRRRCREVTLALYADPVKGYAKRQAITRSFTPERRETHRRRMVEVVHHRRPRGYKLAPEARERVVAAARRRWERELGLPLDHPLREEYRRLIHSKHLPAAEARAIIADQIARLPKHEQQIIKMQLGQARIVGG